MTITEKSAQIFCSYNCFILCFLEFMCERTFLSQMGKNDTRVSIKYVQNTLKAIQRKRERKRTKNIC